MPTTRGLYEVPYTEVERGYSEAYRHGGPEYVRVCDVPWDKSNEFLWDVLGWVEYQSGANLTRHLPEAIQLFEDSRSRPVLYAAEARLVATLGVHDIDPETEESRWLDKDPNDPIPKVGDEVYGQLRYEVVYRPRHYRIKDLADGETELARYVQRTETHAVINFTIPGNTFRFEVPAPPVIQPIMENLTRSLYTIEHTYVWYDIPADAEGRLPAGLRANIKRCVGKCNSISFDNGRFAPETLLCMAPHEELYHSPHGDQLLALHYKFVEILTDGPDFGWNTTFRRTDGGNANAPGFYRIIGQDGQSLLYPKEDFSILFRMDQAP